MDWVLCWERDRWGNKASWRGRGSGSARAGIYEACGNLVIENQEPEKIFEKMTVAIEDSLSDLASSDDGENEEEEDE